MAMNKALENYSAEELAAEMVRRIERKDKTLKDHATVELITEITERNDCNQISRYIPLKDCQYGCGVISNVLKSYGYNVSAHEPLVSSADDDDLVEELEDRGYIIVGKKKKVSHLDIVRRDFENNPTAALNVLQDLLGMQHTATKEQVLEQLKSVL